MVHSEREKCVVACESVKRLKCECHTFKVWQLRALLWLLYSKSRPLLSVCWTSGVLHTAVASSVWRTTSRRCGSVGQSVRLVNRRFWVQIPAVLWGFWTEHSSSQFTIESIHNQFFLMLCQELCFHWNVFRSSPESKPGLWAAVAQILDLQSGP